MLDHLCCPHPRPTSRARPTPVHPRQRAAEQADSRHRRRPPPPTSVPRTWPPTPAAARPAPATIAPRSRRAPRRRGRSPPRCGTVCADRHRSSPSFVVLPDRRSARTTVGTPDFGGSCARTFFEPHRGEFRWAGSFVVSQTRSRDGRQFESQPTRTSTLRKPATPHTDTQSGRYGVAGPMALVAVCAAVHAGSRGSREGSGRDDDNQTGPRRSQR